MVPGGNYSQPREREELAVPTLITGAAGFIGSNLVKLLLDRWPDEEVVSLDSLGYSGNLASLAPVTGNPRHQFVQADIADAAAIRAVFNDYRIDRVFHLAAESHVDRSVVDPMSFVRSNVDGTVVMLMEAARSWQDRSDARFLHVSTDEVFGSLGPTGRFSESTRYDPRSPYSASKAASDHFVRSWVETFDFPALITNCSNNYGPYQFPEKLIPLALTRIMEGRPVPIYGDGTNVRDWLFVEDHCRALVAVMERGRLGETYCVGGESEVANIDLVTTLLQCFDRVVGNAEGTSDALMHFVADRPGHDQRYAIDISKIRTELGWEPLVDLTTGIEATVRWYFENAAWVDEVTGDDHASFQHTWYEIAGRAAE